MCRLAGWLDLAPGAGTPIPDPALTERLYARMRHGGPDGEGSARRPPATLYHCRLALIDPSPAADQPFTAGDWTLVYNGELYNYATLRDELAAAGQTFRTASDTEVVLRALAHWGTDALPRFRGMFALALWNDRTQTLLLARDPLGVKPLYFSHAAASFRFASELKALRELPGHDPTVDPSVLPFFLQRGYIPAPRTIYANVRKLGAGEWLRFSVATGAVTTGRHYALADAGRGDPPADPRSAVRAALRRSCRRRLVADVPVGVLLSGGVDSSLLAATVGDLTDAPVRTYTLGFDDPAFDERPRAAAIARHLGTDHRGFRCSDADFRAVLPELPVLFDEPFGDASGIAAHLLARHVSTDLKCCLSGEGGDELFGGYTKYRATLAFDNYLRRLPLPLRRLAAAALRRGRPDHTAALLRRAGFTRPNLEDQLYKLSGTLAAPTTRAFFERASDYGGTDVLTRLGLTPPPSPAAWSDDALLRNMARADLRAFVEGDLLVKTDRSSMRNGLEVRVPFLDVDLIDLALRLPADRKVSGKRNKVLLRSLLAEHLPPELIDGPKRGFTVPLDRWLRGILRAELRAMGEDRAFAARFGLSAVGLADLITDYLSRRRYGNAYPVWFLYVLRRWHQRWPD